MHFYRVDFLRGEIKGVRVEIKDGRIEELMFAKSKVWLIWEVLIVFDVEESGKTKGITNQPSKTGKWIISKVLEIGQTKELRDWAKGKTCSWKTTSLETK